MSHATVNRLEYLEEQAAALRELVAARAWSHLPAADGSEPTVYWYASTATGIWRALSYDGSRVIDRCNDMLREMLELRHAGWGEVIAPQGWVPPFNRVLGGCQHRAWGDAQALARIERRRQGEAA